MELKNIGDLVNLYKKAKNDEEKLLVIHETCKNYIENFKNDDIEKGRILKTIVEFGDYRTLNYIVKELAWRIDTIKIDNYSTNLLHVLAYRGDANYFNMPENRVYETTKILIDSKISMLRKESRNLTPLMIAAQNGMYEFLKASIEKGIKIGGTDEKGNTLLHIVAEYCGRAEESYEKYGKKRFEQEMERNDYNEEKSYMVEQRKRIIEDSDRDIKRLNEYILFTKELINLGLDSYEKNNYDQTAIDVAVNYCGKKIAVVLKGIDINSDDAKLELQSAGMNIFQACEKKDAIALDAILQLGANPNEEQDNINSRENKMLPLGISMKYFDLPSIKILLNRGASATMFNSEGKHPLTYMYHSGYIKSEIFKDKTPQKILEILVEKGFGLDDYIDDDGHTLLNFAAKNFYYNDTLAKTLIDELIHKSCDVNKSNKNGQTPLMFICASDNREAENSLIILLENGANINLKDKNGQTPLIYAAKNRNNTFAKNYAELLEQFGDILIDVKDNNGKSALDYAVENNNEPFVKWLLGRQ